VAVLDVFIFFALLVLERYLAVIGEYVLEKTEKPSPPTETHRLKLKTTTHNAETVIVVGIAIVVVRREEPSIRTIIGIPTALKPRITGINKVRVVQAPRLSIRRDRLVQTNTFGIIA
jgi:hypothetical protein